VSRSQALQPSFVSLAQASVIAALSTRTLRRAIAEGRLAAHRIGRLIRIDLAELRRWIEADGAAAATSPDPVARP
jgi:excisionase family DNA binding protein